MQLCRACNTRYEGGLKACPRCGRRSSEGSVDSGASGSGSSGPGSTAPTEPLPPVELVEAEVGVDLELGEQDIVEGRQAVAKGARRSRRKTDPPASRGRVREPAPPVIALEPAQVRTLVGEQPGLLEKGLGVHSDEDGQPVGVDYVTPVGDIDLLARDKRGDLVVVMVPEPNEFESVVPDIVQRIGWVRKHLAEGNDVRGIVVMQELPEAVGYAAAGVAGMVSFRAFRVALSFHEIQP